MGTLPRGPQGAGDLVEALFCRSFLFTQDPTCSGCGLTWVPLSKRLAHGLGFPKVPSETEDGLGEAGRLRPFGSWQLWLPPEHCFSFQHSSRRTEQPTLSILWSARTECTPFSFLFRVLEASSNPTTAFRVLLLDAPNVTTGLGSSFVWGARGLSPLSVRLQLRS